MSPFCGQCLGIAREGELRCPLDQQFYLKRDCSGCGQEVYPRELFCAHCGRSLAAAPEAILLPVDASRGVLLAGFCLDLLGVALLVFFQFWSFLQGFTFPMAAVLTSLYRTLSRSGGRQSFGQAVFHLVTVSPNASPSSLRTSFKRSLAEWICLPWSFVSGQRALRVLDDVSQTFEVKLV